jgi:hypothetical protein
MASRAYTPRPAPAALAGDPISVELPMPADTDPNLDDAGVVRQEYAWGVPGELGHLDDRHT